MAISDSKNEFKGKIIRYLLTHLLKKLKGGLGSMRTKIMYSDFDLRNRLIICNHDHINLDDLLIPFFLQCMANHNGWDVKINILSGTKKFNNSYVTRMLPNMNIFYLGDSVEKTIRMLNRGETVVMLVGYGLAEKFLYGSGIQRIFEQTDCKKMYLRMGTDGKVRNGLIKRMMGNRGIRNAILKRVPTSRYPEQMVYYYHMGFAKITKFVYRTIRSRRQTIYFNPSGEYTEYHEFMNDADLVFDNQKPIRLTNPIMMTGHAVRMTLERVDPVGIADGIFG